MLGGFFLAVALTIAAGVVYAYTALRPEPLAADTGCPLSGPTSVTVVLVDDSDVIAPRQQAFLRNQLEEIKAGIPAGGALRVFSMGAASGDLLQPVATVCNPGRPEDASGLTSSVKRVARTYREVFDEPLQKLFDGLLATGTTKHSRIFEAIQSVGITTFSDPQFKDRPRRLVIVSDLLHYSPEFSHYSAPGDFDAFSGMPYYRQVRTNLRDVEVSVLYLRRETKAGIQGPRHLSFWRDMLLDEGALPSGTFFKQVEG